MFVFRMDHFELSIVPSDGVLLKHFSQTEINVHIPPLVHGSYVAFWLPCVNNFESYAQVI